MKTTRSSDAWRDRISQEAADWLVRFSEREIDEAARIEFDRWLCASPEHVRAYLRVSAFWQEADSIDGRPASRDIEALVQLAQREPDVIALHPDQEMSVMPEGSRARPVRRTKLLAMAASVLFTVGIGVSAWYANSRASIYETGIGEQRTVTLPDGSTVIINAGSRIEVAFTDGERAIDLREGQALFTVAKNPSRPFIVRSAGANVRAVGTQFDVNRKDAGSVVTVIEGQVAVTPARSRAGSWFPSSQRREPVPSAPVSEPAGERSEGASAVVEQSPAAVQAGREVMLLAGEQVWMTPQLARKQALSQVQNATAWTQGLLVFEGAPLSEVIREFNRHNLKPLVVTGDDLLQLKVSGTFPAAGGERIVRFLQERFQVSVRETSEDIRISRNGAGS